LFSGRRANFFTDRHTMLSMNCYIFCIVVMKIVRFLLKQIRSSATMSFKAGVVCSIFCHRRNFYLGCRFSFVTRSRLFLAVFAGRNIHRVCSGNRCIAQGFFCDAFLPGLLWRSFVCWACSETQSYIKRLEVNQSTSSGNAG
jgi:hypothetical protein